MMDALGRRRQLTIYPASLPCLKCWAPLGSTCRTMFLLVLCHLLVLQIVTGCTLEQISQCTEGVQNAFTQNLTFATSREELSVYCRNIRDAHNCIRRETSTCHEDIKALYNEAIQQENTVMKDFCKPGPKQTEYLEHAPCLRSVFSDNGPCRRAYDRLLVLVRSINLKETTEATLSSMCCQYYALYECYDENLVSHCGESSTTMLTALQNIYGGMDRNCHRFRPRCPTRKPPAVSVPAPTPPQPNGNSHFSPSQYLIMFLLLSILTLLMMI